MPLSRDQFKTGFQPIFEIWPKSFSGPRLESIYSHVKVLEYIDFKRLVRDIVENFKNAPLPKDFRIAVKEKFKPDHYRNPLHDLPKSTIRCRDCFDTGLLFMAMKGETGFESLMICHCSEGNHVGLTIPRWDKKTSPQLFDKKEFKVELFKPASADIKDQFNRANQWNGYKKLAVDYWKDKLENHKRGESNA